MSHTKFKFPQAFSKVEAYFAEERIHSIKPVDNTGIIIPFSIEFVKWDRYSENSMELLAKFHRNNNIVINPISVRLLLLEIKRYLEQELYLVSHEQYIIDVTLSDETIIIDITDRELN